MVTQQNFNYSKANWKRYQQHLHNEIKIPSILHNPLDIDRYIRYLNYTLLNAAENSIPLMNVNNKKFTISTSTLKIIKIKNYFRKMFQRCHNYTYKKLYYTLNNLVKKRLSQEKNNQFNMYLRNVSQTNNRLWQINKYFSRGQTNLPPIKRSERGDHVAYSNEDKVELIADHFEKIHKQNTTMSTRHHERKVRETINYFLTNNTDTLKPDGLTSPKEVKECIKVLRNTYSTGHDKISVKIIKKLPRK